MDDFKGTYLSYSGASTYANCSLQYYFNYVEKLPKGSSLPREFGTVFHSTLENLHLSFNEKPWSLKETLNFFDDAWLFQTNLWDLEDVKTSDIETYAQYGRVTLSKYYKKYEGKAWFKAPLGAEVYFDVPIVDLETGELLRENWRLRGYIDLIHIPYNTFDIVDHKTSKYVYKDHKINTDMQLSIYKYAVYLMLKSGEWSYGKYDLNQINTYYNVFSRLRTYEHNLYKGERDSSDIKRMLTTINRTIDGIEAGTFVPNNSMLCEYCDFYDVCYDRWGKVDNWKEGI